MERRQDDKVAKVMLENLSKNFDDFRLENKEDHESIKEAQAHTNGNVTELQKWRFFITGGLGVLTVLVVPMLLFIAQQFIVRANAKEDTQKQINQAVVETLDNYQAEIVQ